MGPLLFIIYINDLFKLPLYSQILSFSDDTKLLNISKKNSSLIQLDLIQIYRWSVENNLPINLKTTVVVRFGHDVEKISYFLENSELQVVLKVKDLGIIVDNKLKFADYCFSVLQV